MCVLLPPPGVSRLPTCLCSGGSVVISTLRIVMAEFAASCDREASREARKIIADGLLPAVRQLGAQLSSNCVLHDEHDHLLLFERAKQPVTQRQWRCGLCGKVFKSEQYIDAHLVRRHTDSLPAAGGTCLAEYCDILRCPSWVSALRQHQPGRSSCRPVELEARRAFCQHLMHDCIIVSSERAGLHHTVFEVMDERFCQPVSCSGQQRIRDGLELYHAPMANDESHAGYYTVAALLLVGLGVLYASILMGVGETRADSEGLRARRGRQALRRGRNPGCLSRLLRGGVVARWED